MQVRLYTLLHSSIPDEVPMDSVIKACAVYVFLWAVIRISGTIMPPFSTRVIHAIEKARDDASVKGVLLAVNSPGALNNGCHPPPLSTMLASRFPGPPPLPNQLCEWVRWTP